MAIARKIECVHTVPGAVLAHVFIPGSKREYQKFHCVSLCCTVMVQSPGRNKVVLFRRKRKVVLLLIASILSVLCTFLVRSSVYFFPVLHFLSS